jgi:hypothetical protein
VGIMVLTNEDGSFTISCGTDRLTLIPEASHKGKGGGGGGGGGKLPTGAGMRTLADLLGGQALLLIGEKDDVVRGKLSEINCSYDHLPGIDVYIDPESGELSILGGAAIENIEDHLPPDLDEPLCVNVRTDIGKPYEVSALTEVLQRLSNGIEHPVMSFFDLGARKKL